MTRPQADPIVCPRCDVTLSYIGAKQFHEGSRLAAGFLDGLFVGREHYDVYVCPRCGRIEMFVDGIGEEFRPH